MKCFKKVFISDIFIINYGFYIYIFLLITYFICLFLFYGKYYSNIIEEIEIIVKAKHDLLEIKKKYINILPTHDNIENQNNIFKKNKRRKRNKKNKFSKKETNLNSIHNPRNEESINSNNILQFETEKDINLSIIENNIDYIKIRNILKYTENQKNKLSYEIALIKDKRNFTEYYFSLLKTYHLFLFSFYTKNKDYNSKIIKILLFFFLFGLHMMINALFFNDNTMHEIFIDEGNYNIVYHISQIIYSNIISSVVNKIIKFLALSEKNILEIKSITKIKLLAQETEKVKKVLKIKFILFFIFSFLLLTFFTYYITCFCGIYINTQIHLIKDSVISFGLSSIYPFGLFLIPGIFRIIALKSKKKNREYLYKFSLLIQDLIC